MASPASFALHFFDSPSEAGCVALVTISFFSSSASKYCGRLIDIIESDLIVVSIQDQHLQEQSLVFDRLEGLIELIDDDTFQELQGIFHN
jgi:hypothetical protein